jgi:hypothetical protein
MVQVSEKLSILKMTPYYQKKLYSDRDELQAAEARGEARGKAELIKTMISKGQSIDTIGDHSKPRAKLNFANKYSLLSTIYYTLKI